MTHEKTFTEKAIAVVRNIPLGEVRSYSEVARLAGSPGAARAVGSIMRVNADKTIPCHRVICADGTAGAYNGLQEKSKVALLREEGVVLKGS